MLAVSRVRTDCNNAKLTNIIVHNTVFSTQQKSAKECIYAILNVVGKCRNHEYFPDLNFDPPLPVIKK